MTDEIRNDHRKITEQNCKLRSGCLFFGKWRVILEISMKNFNVGFDEKLERNQS